MSKQGDYDRVSVEVHRRALVNVTNEMAITLIRTSGSPVIYEVKDFATCLMDRDGEHLSFAATIGFHTGSSMLGVRAVIDSLDGGRPSPGDAWILNDSYSAGAMHQGDVGIVTPLFDGEEHIAWAFSNLHVLDVGGSGISGFAPGAYTAFEEGLRFPPTRIVTGGAIDPDWEQYIAANVRLPSLVLNDIRSMIAANNVSQQKLTELISRTGPETFVEYSEINKDLTEDALRGRIEKLPNGTYEATDWNEYDGHGEALLLEVGCRLEVEGSDLRFTFSGAPQVDAFINATPGVVYGNVMTVVLSVFGYGDVPFNHGMWRPIEIDPGPPGTVVNAEPPAAVSSAHCEVGARVVKVVKDLLNQALSVSDDPVLRGRVGGQSSEGIGLTPLAGLGREGGPTVVFFMDNCVGDGGGAQSIFDGLDCYTGTGAPGIGLTNVETNEATQPALYLWRRLLRNSGGPGLYRGGQGLEIAWSVYETEALAGSATVNCAEVPPRGAGGGMPGSTGAWYGYHDTNVEQMAAAGRLPLESDLEGDCPPRTSKMDGLTLVRGDVVRVLNGGGAGVGDPLLRDLDLIEDDLRNEYLTVDHVEAAYGVVVSGDGRIDREASSGRRAGLRKHRLGAAPRAEQRAPKTPGIAVELDRSDGVPSWRCGYCETELCSASRPWREAAAKAELPLAERFGQLGMYVRDRGSNPRMMLAEFFCGSCAGLLSADLYPEGFEGYSSPVLAEAIG